MSNQKPPSWNERYSAEDFYYGTEPNEFLKAQINGENALIKPGGRVLCLAEGEGRNAVYLATLGFEVTAVDSSDVGLEKMQTLAAGKGVRVHAICEDLSRFEIEPGAWDAIVSIWCHLTASLRREVHGKVVKGLAPGGVFLLEAYTPKQLEYGTGGPRSPELLAHLPTHLNELSGLKVELASETVRHIHEGQGHLGLSAVNQIVARKA